MKNKIMVVLLVLLHSPVFIWACEVCENNQPKILKGITHGQGPKGNLDYIITWSAVVIVSFTLFFSIKYLVNPKEKAAGHIKNITVD